jgi:hypothetical protein
MASVSENTVSFSAHCLCKANTFDAKVPRSQLPLPGSRCHCDSCRHLTGGLSSAGVPWPTPRAELDLSKLKVYQFTSNYDVLFCPTCSTLMFFADSKNIDSPLQAMTGTLTNAPADLVQFHRQIFVHDTVDGGASVWHHQNANGSEIKSYKLSTDGDDTEELPRDWPPFSGLTGYEAKKEDSIPIHCKCRGIEFILHRGDYSDIPEDKLPSNVDPKTHKITALFCGCDSCRLQSGVDVFNWTYTDLKYITFSNSEKPFPASSYDLKKLVDENEPALGTLKYYSSSEDVDRYFCSTCSACIFYATTSRPTIIDVAVGVLDASDGARAEGFLSWAYGARMSSQEDGDGGWREKLFSNVVRCAEEYRVARGYPKISVRI